MSAVVTREIKAKFTFTHAANSTDPFSLDVDLTLPGKGVTAILGASGSGKTTFLRCIAGLQKVKRGKLIVRGDVWQSEDKVLPTHKRALGYVFQESSLFNHLTAHGNLTYAIKRSGNPEMRERYQKVIALMGIQNLLQQYPDQLSGGERQRVAIAQALLIDPRILLMDEPLASLDAQRKDEILPYLEKLRHEFEFPILYVSHSVDEVTRLADYLVVLDKGRAVASGPIVDVLSRVDLPVCLGEHAGVVVQAKLMERDARWHLVRAVFEGGELWVRDNGGLLGDDIRLRVLARDISLTLTLQEDSSILNRLAAQVVSISRDECGAMSLIQLRVGAVILIARIANRSVDYLQLKVGNRVWAQIKSVAIVG